jgi:copper chaperone CopZ
VYALPGIHSVKIDLASGRVEIEHDAALTDAATIRNSLEDGGYSVVD